VRRIKYADYEVPDGDWVADGNGLREWTPEVSRDLAEDAMLLAMGAERAETELARREAALEADAVDERRVAG
jgi:hypothetical protein